MATLKFLAIIPAYNEEASIQNITQSAGKFLPICVVDDGSSDRTVERAQEAGAHVIMHEKNKGKGAALRTGFHYALRQDVSAVITLDADGQHEPREIPRFLDAFQEKEYDLIIGARNFAQMPFSRRLANTIGKTVYSWAAGQKILDNQCGYRLIERGLLEFLLDSQEPGFEYEMEMILVCLKNRFKLGWLPIQTIYGEEKSHIRSLPHVKNFFRMALKIRSELFTK